MFEKSRGLIIGGAFLLLVAGLVLLFQFGISDLVNGPTTQEIMETKPWRPLARAIFSVVMAAILIFFCGLVVKIAARHEN
jgi:ABC-type Fe3+ transport system permease subunit